MNTKHEGMIERVKDKVVAAIKGTGNVVQASASTTTSRTSSSGSLSLSSGPVS